MRLFIFKMGMQADNLSIGERIAWMCSWHNPFKDAKRREMGEKKMRINFIHLDLGLGGAERLIVDAACALKERGHTVLIATSHHDSTRCFDETNPSIDGLISRDIRCAGDWIPRHVLGGRFHLLFAVLRMIFISFKFANTNAPQVLIVDQVSFIVPLLQWLFAPGVPVLFYCHFPDKLLAPKSKSVGRRLYRLVFDRAEEWTTNQATRIVVNSKFTASVVREVFPNVAKTHDLAVLYPCVDLEAFDAQASDNDLTKHFSTHLKLRQLLESDPCFVLSINRFERKKGLDLALRAFQLLSKTLQNTAFLVMAGGYDVRVKENVDHLVELKILARDLGIEDKVFFVPSCSQEEKRLLLDKCRVLVYTPQGEHFGIVPIEAGACSKPVIACNSGGPLESIANGETGLLVDPTSDQFAKAMTTFLDGSEGVVRATEFGRRARQRVEAKFSRNAFGAELERVCLEMAATTKVGAMRTRLIVAFMVVIFAGLMALIGLSSEANF